MLIYNQVTHLYLYTAKTMSHKGRQKKLPSAKHTNVIRINLNTAQLDKLERICTELNITYTEYFRVFLAKDKR